MIQLPLKAILFWIAVTLAPPDTSQILVKGPDATWAWTKQTSGWSFSADRSVWAVEANTVTTSVKGKRPNTSRPREVRSRHQGPRLEGVGHAEIAARRLAGQRGRNLGLHAGEGTATAKRYVVRFRRNPAAAKGVVQLGYVGETSADKRSFADSGHAIAFDRPAGREIPFGDPDLREPLRLSAAAQRGFPRLCAGQRSESPPGLLVSLLADRARPGAMVHARPAGDRSARALPRGPGVQRRTRPRGFMSAWTRA